MAFIISSGCSDWSVKRSANNKLFDSKGFAGGKRRPLYNKKYIDQAKRNIKTNNYEDDYDDEDDEAVDSAVLNRSMYRDMIAEERRNAKLKSKRDHRLSEYDDRYPRLSDAKARSSSPDSMSEHEMKQELQEIKKLLANTRKDMTKYRCPLQDQADKEKLKQQKNQAEPANYKKTHSISNIVIDDD